MTPLQLAVNWNQDEVAQILREHGAHLSTNPLAQRTVTVDQYIRDQCDHCPGYHHHE